MRPTAIIFLFVLGVLGLAAYSSLYVVKETERAVVLSFGELSNPDVPSGLHVLLPLRDKVRKFDARILTLDAPPERYLTIEKKPLDVDFYAKWRIIDTAKFYTATSGDEKSAERLLTDRINTGLRNQFGERTVHEVVSGERDKLMVELTQQLDVITRTEFGVELVDVRVKRINLPERVSQLVFDRMKSERVREAQQHRSTGREEAEKIRAAADREKTITESEGYKQAEIIRGEGDGLAAAIYAKAYNRDPEFQSFLMSLTAYKESFNQSSDLMVVDRNSEFFKHMDVKSK